MLSISPANYTRVHSSIVRFFGRERETSPLSRSKAIAGVYRVYLTARAEAMTTLIEVHGSHGEVEGRATLR